MEVSDFFSLLSKEDEYILSPPFSFLDTKWQFQMYPNGEVAKNTVEWISLYLVKDPISTSVRHVAYSLGIRKKDGSIYHSFSASRQFDRVNKGWGVSKFILRSSLLHDKTQVELEGTVTFYCILRWKANDSKDTASQTTPSKSYENLLQNLLELLNGEGGDIILKVKDEEIKAHKGILKVHSPVFRSMFSRDTKEENTGIVEVIDCEPAIFRDFLHFLYCLKLEGLSTDTVFDLYSVADKYDVIELRAICVEFITDNLSMDTFFDSLTLALKFNELELLKHVTDFYIENALNIIKTCQWLSFMKENPVEANELYMKQLEKNTPK